MIAEDVTYWARNGDVNIAYKIVGGGPMDLVFLTGLVSHIEVILEEPGLRRWFERLGRIARVILVDRRGSGLSDPLTGPLSLDEEIEDVVAVLDAVGTDRAVLQAYASGGPLAIALRRAPTRSARCALVLYASMVRTLQDVEGGYHWADTREVARRAHRRPRRRRGGRGANAELMAPSAAGDPRAADLAGPPGAAVDDPGGRAAPRREPRRRRRRARSCGSLRVPTLVLHRTDDQLIDVRHSRYLAEHVPGVRYVELPGRRQPARWSATPRRCSARSRSSSPAAAGAGVDRELLTVLFTDVVDATRPAAAAGRRALARPALDPRRRRPRERGALRRPRGQDDRRRLPRDLRRPRRPRRVRCARAVVAGVARARPRGPLRPAHGRVRAARPGRRGHGGPHRRARLRAGRARRGPRLGDGLRHRGRVGAGAGRTGACEQLRGVPGHWPLFALA